MKFIQNISLFLITLTTINTYSQQQPTFNMQFLNQNLYNPSTVGLGDQINAFLVNKSYLTGIDGNPQTLFLNVDGPAIEDKVGVGLSLYNDNLGVTNKLGVYGSGSYRVKFADEHNLSFGLSLGMLQFSVNQDEIEVENTNDPLLVNKSFGASTVDGAFGLTYINKNIQVGLAVNQLFASNAELTDNVNFNMERSYVFSGKYTLYVDSRKDLSFSPMVIGRYAESNMPQEAYLIASYKNKFFLAPSYKSTGAVGVSIAASILNGFKVGYSYETLIQEPVSGYQNGGHEIMVGYSFDIRGKSNKRLDDKIKKLDQKLEEFELRQNDKDKLQDDILKEQQKDIDENKENIEENKNKSEELDKEIKETQRELEELKSELRKAGILKEENVSDFDNEAKGYYIVIASVKDKNISEARMKSDYLDRGFKRMYNKNTGWHYAYSAYFTDFNKALKKLKETRAGEFNDAWIHVLK